MTRASRTVLVIDNSPECCDRYRADLIHDDVFAYRVLAQSYQEALRQCPTRLPDGIILRLGESETSEPGFHLLDQLTLGLGRHCPPVVVVGCQQVKLAVQALKRGAADYLVRDQMTGDDLRHTLRSAIENAELKRQLQSSQERFQTSVENLMDCFGIYTAMRDETGQIVDFRIDYVNRAACENNHMSRQQQLGRGLCEVLPGHRESGLFDAYCHLVETGEPVVKDSVVFEDTYGGTQQLVRAFDIRATRLNDGFVASWRDITDRKRLELELNYTVMSLQQEQSRLKQLLDEAPVGIGIGSPTGEVTVINDTMLQQYGLTRQQFEQQGMNWRDFIPDANPTALGAIEAYIGCPVSDILSDAARFRLLAETIQDVFWMSDLRVPRILYVSPAFEQIWGRSPEAIYQDHGAWLETVHPEDREIVQRAFAEAPEAVIELEYRILRPDGEIRWIRDRGFALEDADGNLQQTVGVAQDITPQKQTTLALRQSEERYRTLFETMEDGFCVLEMIFDQAQNPIDYRFIELNPAFERHTGLRDAAGKTARQLLPDLEGHWFDIYGRVALTGEPIRFEEGSTVMNRWFEVYAFRLGGAESRRVALLFRDISDRKAIETQREQLLRHEQTAREAAERANRVKDEFLAILSHELRSPLNPILGWSKLLQTRQLNETKTKQALATIERNAKLQTQLIDDLLDVARILRGKLTLETHPIGLTAVIEAAVEIVHSAAAGKSIELYFQPPTGPCRVVGDPARLQQIVWNLLSNAIKFTPAGGQVHIGLCEDNGQACITVIDTGQGISADFLPHIFESFRQEDVSITRKHGGLGLGLSIVRYLVEAHGGTITADSPGEGQGATFTVWVPLVPGSAMLETASPEAQQLPNLQGLRILAIDDEVDARQLLEAILTGNGVEVIVTDSAEQVLEVLPQFRPQVLIFDLSMPNVDGYELINQVRQLAAEQGGNTPALALTAYARQEDRQRVLANGFQHHLAKPFEPADLVRIVAALACSQPSGNGEPDRGLGAGDP